MTDDTILNAISKRLGTYPSTTPDQSLGPIISTGIGILDDVKQHPVRLGSLVDISGVSMSGKTQVLHAITAHVLLKHFGGRGPFVCWFDLNRGLCPNRLRGLMRKMRDESFDVNCDVNCEDQIDAMTGLRVYYPSSTISMCSSLHALLEYIFTEEGNEVCTVVIDSLGSFHYVDKHSFERADLDTSVRKQSHELILCKVLEQLLLTRKVTVFVSKSCLFGETKLDVPWPFPKAGVPMIPKEFMPDLWKSISSHILLTYHLQTLENGESNGQRGIIALKYIEPVRSPGRRALVSAAAVVIIDNEGITMDTLHVVV